MSESKILKQLQENGIPAYKVDAKWNKKDFSVQVSYQPLYADSGVKVIKTCYKDEITGYMMYIMDKKECNNRYIAYLVLDKEFSEFKNDQELIDLLYMRWSEMLETAKNHINFRIKVTSSSKNDEK